MRKEKDALGEVEIPEGALFGIETMRSFLHFQIGSEKMPVGVLQAIFIIKKAAAKVHLSLQLIEKEKGEAILKACDALLQGKHSENFPLVVWQTGSGTQTNMNVNEVIANLSNQFLGNKVGSYFPVHPNDDVNKSQSSNDVFPTAMHIPAVQVIKEVLLPELLLLQEAFHKKSKEFVSILKVGRTHYMDAVPLSLGDEFSAYETQIKKGREAIENTLKPLYELAIGGTAVGTGLNAPKEFSQKMAEEISFLTGHPFISSPNKFEAISTADALVEASGALKRLSCSLIKIMADLRLLASGPRCGIGEIILPANEKGSSIMPGKVNPTQCEALSMVCCQVIGNDLAISLGGMQGCLEMNVFKPMIIYNFLQSATLLRDAIHSFRTYCLEGIQPNLPKIQEHMENNLMIATFLNPLIGYDKASKAVQKAYKENISLKEAVISLGFMTKEEFEKITFC